jgi:ubiquinone/menaquinone biosynthesis C-methylase UbiE
MLAEADAWHKRNRGDGQPYEASANFARLLHEIVRLGFKPKSICEVGASDGYNLAAFEQMFPGSTQVVGIEASAQAVNQGNKELNKRGSSAKLVQGSGHSLPYLDDSFDLVYLGFVLYLADQSSLHLFYDEAIRVLKPGGLLCLTDFFPTGSTPEYKHDPMIKIVKRDHAQGLIDAGRGTLKALYLQARGECEGETTGTPQILEHLEENPIFIKKKQA